MMKRYDDANLSAVEIVARLIATAIKERASDIHLEPASNELGVRFRIDGVLSKQSTLPDDLKLQIISRLKVLARIDIAEHRVPQDGGFLFESDAGAVDLRVSTFPSLYGQKMVIRILNRGYDFLRFEQLGFEPQVYEGIKQIIDKPQGLFLVTGPTGSGKTTTLYALLDYLNTSERNIITLEDPVEYRIEGITQGHIQERIGFDFAQGIRSLLRQDPDIIMVGEIRDSETARTAIRAALTGHLVLSTLHTNDAPSTVMRLIDMGIEPYLLNAALTGVLSQRLVRVLCSCKKMVAPTSVQEKLLNQWQVKVPKMARPYGCAECNQTGYKSRVGIFEFMPMTEPVRELVVGNASCTRIRQQAGKDGMQLLADNACQRLAHGLIAIEDVIRLRS
jgi:type IV pilus assembly protein PilB